MLHLPSYAATPIGRALISEIIAERPDGRLIVDDWGTRDCPHYSGKPAAMLRRLRSEWVQRELAALDVQFHVTGGLWDEDASTAILATETADALIERVLAEPVSERRAA